MSQVNVIAVICFRNVIRCVESRLVGRPQSFVENALELKAYYIGSANRDCQNPLLVLIILLLIALAEASTLVVVIRLSSLVLLMEYSSEYSIFNLLTPLERDRNRFLSNFVVRQNK